MLLKQSENLRIDRHSIKVAVVGAGNWGCNLVRTFNHLDALAAVAEANQDAREKISGSYPGVTIYHDFFPLLDDDEIQALIIATPAGTHYQLAKAALLAGKDVFLEKPMVLSVAQAEELVMLAEQKGMVLMVGHLLLYQPAVQWMKQYISAGAIGNVQILHQERLKLGRVRAEEDVLWSFGAHDIAVLLYLVGSAPNAARAIGHNAIQNHIADDVYLHLRFPGGIQAHIHVSWIWPEQRRCLTIIGSEAMLIYDELKQTVTLHNKGITSHLANRDDGSRIVFQSNAEPLRLECQHFLDAVREREMPLSSGRSALEVIRVLEEASSDLTVLRYKGGEPHIQGTNSRDCSTFV